MANIIFRLLKQVSTRISWYLHCPAENEAILTTKKLGYGLMPVLVGTVVTDIVIPGVLVTGALVVFVAPAPLFP